MNNEFLQDPAQGGVSTEGCCRLRGGPRGVARRIHGQRPDRARAQSGTPGTSPFSTPSNPSTGTITISSVYWQEKPSPSRPAAVATAAANASGSWDGSVFGGDGISARDRGGGAGGGGRGL